MRKTILGVCLSVGMIMTMSHPAYPQVRDPSKPQLAVETIDGDNAWNDSFDRTCKNLRDRVTDSQSDIDECQRLQDQEPLCLVYKGFASAYFSMKDQGVSYFIADSGIQSMIQKHTYSGYVIQLISSVAHEAFTADRSVWKTNEQFSDYAYKACMEAHPL
jgi:hypothetical protein